MRRLAFPTLWLLAVGVAGYAVYAYSALPIGAAVHPDMRASFEAHRTAVYLHVFGAAVAMLLGPLQFTARVRERWLNLHRWTGRAYLGLGVLVGGLAGLYLARFAYGGLTAQIGFGALAVLWLYSGVRAYLAIRRRSILEHQRWMTRNYAFTFAAVTLRLYVPASFMAGLDFAGAYAVIAWLCWVPNLVVAEVLIQSGRFKPAHGPAAAKGVRP